MPALQILSALKLGAADTKRLQQLIGVLQENPTPSLEQVFLQLFPLADEKKAKEQFRQLLHAINAAIRAQNHSLTITTGNKHQPLNQRIFTLHLAADPALDLKFEEFSSDNSYATAREAVIVQQFATKRPLIKYFVSYAHADRHLADKFYQQLKIELGAWQEVQFVPWRDDMLELGDDFRAQIIQALHESQCGILLYSPAFFASSFILQAELPKLLVKPFLAAAQLTRINAEQQIPEILKDVQYFHSNNKCYQQTRPQNDFVHAFVNQFAEQASKALSSTKSPAATTDAAKPRTYPEFDLYNIHLEDKRLATTYAKPGQLSEAAPGLNNPTEPANTVAALDNLLEWWQDPQQPAYATVLAEYGMGKTTLCQSLVLAAKERRKQGEALPAIIYLDLRNLRQRDELANATLADIVNALIAGNWQHSVTQPFSAADVLQAVREEQALLIFDGLDEVLTTVDNATGGQFLRTIWSALPPQWVAKRRQLQLPVGKLLLTCRSHYFPSVSREQRFYTGESREGIRPGDYHVLWLLPLTDAQIREYVQQNFAGQSERILAVIEQVHKLSDLAKRPLNLRFITEIWPRLEQRKAQTGQTLLTVDFYRELIQQVLERDDDKAQLNQNHKRELLENLAAELWRRGVRAWAIDDLENWTKDYIFAQPRWQRDYGLLNAQPKAVQTRLEELLEDLRTACFIVREGENQFRFAHTSIQEYALACYLKQALLADNLTAWAMPILPSVETLDFLGELLQGADQAQAVAGLQTLSQAYLPQASELLFHYALRAHQRDYPCCSLRDCQMQGAQLADINLIAKPQDFDLSGADFSGADLSHSCSWGWRVDNADFKQANLAYSEWHHGSARAARFQQTALQAVVFRGMDLRQADFSAAKAEAGEWRDCELDADTLAQVQGDYSSVACRVQGVVQQMLPAAASELAMDFGIRHMNIVSYCAWSPDGTRIISASCDNTLKLWNSADGRLLLTMCGHVGAVRYCAWSPDGRQVISASADKTLKLWDGNDGRLLATFTGHEASVSHCLWSPDGRQVLSAADDSTLMLWNSADGSELRTLRGHSDLVTHCAWSPDGKQVLSASRDATLKIWHAADGGLLATLSGHEEAVWHCAWSPDGRQILSASFDKTLKLWDSVDGSLLAILTGHSAPVSCCAWSPDGRQLLSASFDKTLKRWDSADGGLLTTLTGHQGVVTHCAWSPDGRQILSASADATLRVWNSIDGRLLITLSGYTAPISHCAAWSPDGKRVLGAFEGALKLWDSADGRLLVTLTGYFGGVIDYAWSANANKVLSASTNNSLTIWDSACGCLLATLIGHEGSVNHCAWSPDNNLVLSASSDKTLKIWSSLDGRLLATLIGHDDAVISCSWSPDGRQILSASFDKTLKLWDSTDGHLLATLTGNENWITHCAFSPDGRQVLGASLDGTIKLWNSTDGGLLATIGDNRLVRRCAWSPDGRQVLIASDDRTLKLWNSVDGRLLATLIGHKSSVMHCAWSADGRQILSASSDNTLKLWNSDDGCLLTTLIGHYDVVRYGSWSPNGKQILSASNDGTLKFWDSATGTLLMTLRGHQGAVTRCEWSADGRQIISCGFDGMRLWRAADGKALRAFYHPRAELSSQAQYLSLVNANADLTDSEDSIEDWQVVAQSDEAWRFLFWRGKDNQGRLRRWPYEAGQE